jgi:outer membrane lipoprotein SlyB
MFKTIAKLTAAAAMLATVSACTPPAANSSHYYGGQAMRAAQVEYGTIMSGRHVELRNTKGDEDAFAGAALGGIAGALVGEKFGKGNGKTLMTGAGAIAGAALGSNMAKNANRAMAQEWIVKLDNGRTIAVVQQDPSLMVGSRVTVITSGTETRLAPLR